MQVLSRRQALASTLRATIAHISRHAASRREALEAKGRYSQRSSAAEPACCLTWRSQRMRRARNARERSMCASWSTCWKAP
jgi:hypothetical protein